METVSRMRGGGGAEARPAPLHERRHVAQAQRAPHGHALGVERLHHEVGQGLVDLVLVVDEVGARGRLLGDLRVQQHRGRVHHAPDVGDRRVEHALGRRHLRVEPVQHLEQPRRVGGGVRRGPHLELLDQDLHPPRPRAHRHVHRGLGLAEHDARTAGHRGQPGGELQGPARAPRRQQHDLPVGQHRRQQRGVGGVLGGVDAEQDEVAAPHRGVEARLDPRPGAARDHASRRAPPRRARRRPPASRCGPRSRRRRSPAGRGAPPWRPPRPRGRPRTRGCARRRRAPPVAAAGVADAPGRCPGRGPSPSPRPGSAAARAGAGGGDAGRAAAPEPWAASSAAANASKSGATVVRGQPVDAAIRRRRRRRRPTAGSARRPRAGAG